MCFRFFTFMYVLGVACAFLTVPQTRGAHLYEHLYSELFVDVCLLCLLLAAMPRCIKRWVAAMTALVLYLVALVDVSCFDRFGSTLTPTMLMLVGETDAREAGEFMQSFLTWDSLVHSVGPILLIMLLHLLTAVFSHRLDRLWERQESCMPYIQMYRRRKRLLPYAVLAAGAVLFVQCLFLSWHNKVKTWQLLTAPNIGKAEHMLTGNDTATLYAPIYRLAFSIHCNMLTAQQLDTLIAKADETRVDSCSQRSPIIVLIIGESFGRHHSSQYGYFMPTTPRQEAREKAGSLVKFNDVVAPWNLTSFVFKNLFSMHTIEQEDEWCDQPLFPELFRKAGYHVTFLTNQFIPKAKEAVYDFSGGFFLNNPTLSAAQFDTRNERTHLYDEGLLREYDRLVADSSIMQAGKPQLVMFHLLGQHTSYVARYPKKHRQFRSDDYLVLRPNLNIGERITLARYDNATLYNDSIVDQICQRFEDREAVVIYMPDHGEEVYEEDRGFFCRNHSSTIDYPLAKYEFEVPFWIWTSNSYAERHPDVMSRIRRAANRRLMTDALPHSLLYLAGIRCKNYRPEHDVLSDEYNNERPRILKGYADYDRLLREHEARTKNTIPQQ